MQTHQSLLTIDQALNNYNHLHRSKPKFGMDVLSEDFKAQDIVIVQNDGTRKAGTPVRFGFYAMILCIYGGSKRSVNQHEYIVKQHSLQLLPPGTIHSFEDTHERSEYYVLLFEKSYIDMNEIMAFHDIHFDAVDLSTNHFNKVKELYEEIDAELKNKNENFMTYVRILLGQILLILQREKLQAIVPAKQSKSDLICSQFLCLVEENFLNFKSIADYAQIIELTPKYLSETIKEKLGKSALHFIHKRTIKEAEYLLAYTQMSIYAISTNLKFQDASQFSRFFKQHKGLSPKNYRINLQIIY